MDAIPKERQFEKMNKITRADADLPPVRREGQSVLVLGEGRLAGIVVPLPQPICEAIPPLPDFLCHAKGLLTRKFRVAISDTIGFRPIDCAFRD